MMTTVQRGGSTICSSFLANTYFLRLRGLMGRDVNELESLLLTPCNQIHTCFMGYAIDVVYLDARGQVLHVEHRAQPWKFFKAVKGARSVLELPAGAASRYDIIEGEKLEVR